MLRELLLAGLGLTLTPDFVVADLLASGRLVELLPAHRPAAQGVFGLVAHQRHVPRKVAVFMDFVGEQLAYPAKPIARASQPASRYRYTTSPAQIRHKG
jgi:DNA-binding transcriptional LysR family regulator